MGTKAKTYLFSRLIDGYLMSIGARGLSENTIIDYSRTLRKFAVFLGSDLPVHEITVRDVERFLFDNKDLANKTILNYYVGLSAAWKWFVAEELAKENIVRRLTPPKPESKQIIPLTEAEVKAILSALGRSRAYVRKGTTIDHSLGSFERNRAMILLMLDTGIRASELCDLKVEDLNPRSSKIHVRKGKGMKERHLPVSPRTAQMIWRYLAARETLPSDPLFAGRLNRPITREKLASMLAGIGKRAGVAGVHPHRFRHTFAIQYLRNGGNAYTLQAMLGHSSLEMVRRYLQIAEVDVDAAHRRASPVDGWRL